MTPYQHVEKAFATWLFQIFRSRITADFRKAYGGTEIWVDIRILGWKVGEQKILDKKPTGPAAGHITPIPRHEKAPA